VTTFDILSSAWSTCSTKGPVMTAKQTPWMHHWSFGICTLQICFN